jgi:type II secretory ATPase GspE/PulE/Tfp pilus assembly ATPase PilB-like protein
MTPTENSDTFTRPAPTGDSLAEYLVKKKLVTQTAMEAALAEQKVTNERLGLILNRSGFIQRKTLFEAILATNPDKMQGEQIFSNRVPTDVLTELRAMIVAETDNEVFIATTSSEFIVQYTLTPYYPNTRINFVPVNHEALDSYLTDLNTLMSEDNNLVDRLLRQAARDNVSDIHIIPRYSSFSVFFRQLGVRRLVHEGTLDEYNTLSSRLKDLSRMDLAERRIPQDGGFSTDYDGKMLDLRVATLPTSNSEYIVIRLLDPDRVQPSLDGLGVTGVLDWRKGVSRPDGLCLICGPTGSGKTTTLNASIKEMDRFGRAIFSIEDPVEYRIPYVGQVNVNPTLHLDFARAVRAFMRSDPDVIILGEVRDAETARNAVKAAETGHLVLATLHTGSIFGAVQRLRDLEVPAHELRYLLRTVLVQRLMRVYCTSCGGKGCVKCSGTGFGGRTVVSECAYFSGEKEVSALLNGDRWWISMLEDGVNQVVNGRTSSSEVIRVFGAEAETLLTEKGLM